MRHSNSHSTRSTTSSALDELLGAEQQAERRLAKADEDANSLIEEARHAVAEADLRAAADLEAELAAIERTSAGERQTAVDAIEREAMQTVARYDAAAPEPVARRIIDLVVHSAQRGGTT